MGSYFGDDRELLDEDGHMPNTLGRTIASTCAVMVGLAAAAAFLYIVLFV